MGSMPQSGRTLPEGKRQGRSPENGDPTEPRFGWQCLASADVEKTFLQNVVWPELSPADRAFPQIAMWSICRHPVHLFTSGCRIALGTSVICLFVVFGALPLSAHFCRCGRPLDVRGHHRSACGRAGVLGRRKFPLESAAAQRPRA